MGRSGLDRGQRRRKIWGGALGRRTATQHLHGGVGTGPGQRRRGGRTTGAGAGRPRRDDERVGSAPHYLDDTEQTHLQFPALKASAMRCSTDWEFQLPFN
jgi:hypothetical protein